MIKLLHNLMIIVTIYQYFHKEFCIPYYTMIAFMWIIYKNECIISFFDKIKTSSNYQIGDNAYNTPDLIINSWNFFRFDRLLNIIVIPIHYYFITKDIFISILLFIINSILVIENNIFKSFLQSRYRYIFLPIMIYIMTNNNLIKNNLINIMYNIMILFGIFVVIYTYKKYDNQNDLFEMTIIGLLSLIYLQYINISKLIK